MVVALAGGVGGAKLVRGLAELLPPGELAVIVNTADDITLHGLRICPDLDTVTYTLAGAANPTTGWGLDGDSFHCLSMLDRLGQPAWFALGDRDLAIHLARTERLAQGQRLTKITAALASALGVHHSLLPMTDDPVENRVVVAGRDLHFQEYLVREGAPRGVERVYFRGIETARPTPEVLGALETAKGVVLCPSNPMVSIGPVLALPGVEQRLRERSCLCVAVSPLVGGKPVRGPLTQLLQGITGEVSNRKIAEFYVGVADTFVVDTADADDARSVEPLGLSVEVTDTLMPTLRRSVEVAEAVLELLNRNGTR